MCGKVTNLNFIKIWQNLNGKKFRDENYVTKMSTGRAGPVKMLKFTNLNKQVELLPKLK